MQSGDTDLRPALVVARALTLLGLLIILCSNFLQAQTGPGRSVERRVDTLVNKGVRLSRKADLQSAERVLREALAMAPDSSRVRLELAYVLTKQRRLLEAYEISMEVAHAEPRNARAFSILGATLVAAGRFREARVLLNNAWRLNRKDDLAWAAMGMLEFYENNVDRSFSHLRQADFLRPREPDYVFAFAQVAARLERYSEAAEKYDEFLRIASITDSDRRDRIKGLIGFLRFLGANNNFYASVGKSSTTVPFELEGDRPIVRLRVNGRPEPLRFVLDTGSGISVISTETARRLRLRPVAEGGSGRGLGGDGRFPIVYGFIKDIMIGDVTVKNVPVYMRPFHENLQSVDGYIGLALISKFLTTIDYGDRTFSLVRKEIAPGGVGASERSLPLRLTSSGFLSGEVQIEGMDEPLNFILDTGASVSVISDRVAKADAISRYVNTHRMRVIGAAGVTEDTPTFLLPKVSFGSHSRTGIMAVALDLDVINEAAGFEQSGILGGNFLKNYRLTFDFKNSLVTFDPVRSGQNR